MKPVLDFVGNPLPETRQRVWRYADRLGLRPSEIRYINSEPIAVWKDGRGIYGPVPEPPMKTHELKCWPEAFEATVQGEKRFEYRKNDRDFQECDKLILKEFVPCPRCHGTGRSYVGSANGEGEICGCGKPYGRFTGRVHEVTVTFVLADQKFGLKEGYCVLSIM